MPDVLPGRFTADLDREVTVFLIGMRFNKPWQVHRWLPVFVAMPRMLRHLAQHPEIGMLHQQTWFGRTTMLISYWESPEHLQRFAADRDAPHLEPWRRYQRRIAGSGDVGIFHETYVVGPGRSETVYANMPAFGLGAALGTTEIGPGTQTAKRRLSGERGESG